MSLFITNMAISEMKGQEWRSILTHYPVRKGQRYINLNPGHLSVNILTDYFILIFKCCYDHQTVTAIVVVGYHRTNTAIAVF